VIPPDVGVDVATVPALPIVTVAVGR